MRQGPIRLPPRDQGCIAETMRLGNTDLPGQLVSVINNTVQNNFILERARPREVASYMLRHAPVLPSGTLIKGSLGRWQSFRALRSCFQEALPPEICQEGPELTFSAASADTANPHLTAARPQRSSLRFLQAAKCATPLYSAHRFDWFCR